jgi:hypothetical protein
MDRLQYICTAGVTLTTIPHHLSISLFDRDYKDQDLAFTAAFPGGLPAVCKDDDVDELLEHHDESDEEGLLDSTDEEESDVIDGPQRRTQIKQTKKLSVGVLEGTTFLNNYIVINTIGRGSYGKVKLCLNIADDALYAVKVIDKALVSSPALYPQTTCFLHTPCA